ncbi:MAG: hypothetical protein JWM11_3021 [Planctomycetaceae bacterium]|nr:hypothetical protein [Planctomycetaceae bacterium]
MIDCGTLWYSGTIPRDEIHSAPFLPELAVAVCYVLSESLKYGVTSVTVGGNAPQSPCCLDHACRAADSSMKKPVTVLLPWVTAYLWAGLLGVGLVSLRVLMIDLLSWE